MFLNNIHAVTQNTEPNSILLPDGLLYSQKILYADFATPQGPPVTSPLAIEGGNLTLVQTDGQFTIAGGLFSFPAQASPVWGDQGFYSATGLARQAGRMIYVEPVTTSGRWVLGWSDNAAVHTPLANNPHAIQSLDGTTLRYAYVANTGMDLNIGSADLPIGVILRDSGAWYLAMSGADVIMTWVDGAVTTTPLYPYFSNFDGVGTLDNFWVGDLLTVWNSQWGGPLVERSATPSTGQIIDSAADCHVEFTWTPGAGETLEIRFRRTDDNNCMLIRCIQASNTIRLYEVSSGVETEKAGGVNAQTWTVGTPYRILITARGTVVNSFVNNAARAANSTSTLYQTVRGAKVAGFATGSDFASWLYTITGAAKTALQGFFLT